MKGRSSSSLPSVVTLISVFHAAGKAGNKIQILRNNRRRQSLTLCKLHTERPFVSCNVSAVSFCSSATREPVSPRTRNSRNSWIRQTMEDSMAGHESNRSEIREQNLQSSREWLLSVIIPVRGRTSNSFLLSTLDSNILKRNPHGCTKYDGKSVFRPSTGSKRNVCETVALSLSVESYTSKNFQNARQHLKAVEAQFTLSGDNT